MSDRLEVGSMVAGFAGAVLSPGEPWYDDARAIFNSMIDRRPAVIAHCASKDDVIAAVRSGPVRSGPVRFGSLASEGLRSRFAAAGTVSRARV